MRIVLTGHAYLDEEFITRKRIVAACKRFKIQVENRISERTAMLVASRHDTAKARDARKLGVRVTNYDELLTGILRGRV